MEETTADILRIVNKEINDYEQKQIQIVPGFVFNQKSTIEQIYYYYNSQFQTGEIDEDGDKKYFYNIVKNPCKVHSKAIDFDTKNIHLLTAESGNPLKTWFMERDLKLWMRDKQFGKVLNRLFQELPVFGSVVLKVVNGYPQFVDLRNFVVEQNADTLENSNYITEIHNFTTIDFRKAGKEMGWDKSKIDEAIKEFRKMKGTSHIRVYERYGEIETDNGAGTYSYPYKRVFIADVGVDTYDQNTNQTTIHKGVLLKENEWEGNPYWEFHLEKMPGRWLGIGVVETLFEPQIRENELANLQSKASYWRAIILFKSNDPNMGGKNLYQDYKNGGVVDTSQGDTNQLDISDRNLAFFNEETLKWMKNRDELINAYAPVGTTPTAVKVAQQNFITYFEQIQENIALDVKEMLYEVIIPQFQKENTPEHTLRIVGKDLDIYVSMIKDVLVAEEVVKQVLKGKFPTSYDAEVIGIAIENSFKKTGEFLKKLPKDFYKDVKWDVDIDITGESVDTRVRSAAKFSILQAIQADPTMLTDPTKRKILFSFAEDSGINLNDVVGQEQKTIQDQITQTQPGGGGISAPQMAPNPMAGSQTKTI